MKQEEERKKQTDFLIGFVYMLANIVSSDTAPPLCRAVGQLSTNLRAGAGLYPWTK